ncbi:MAG TPA: UDP-N-acetylglucosamine 4-epimerase [Rhodobacteraceae bacterium]|nr:UDP-N-acetylglucosamine 4-epimerase [Paracoccaceae bacterium]
MKQKITVIGGSGFVGTNFCQFLADLQIPFEIVDLKLSTKFAGYTTLADVRDIHSLRKAVMGNVVVNLAAVHRDDVSNKNEYFATNVQGAANIAQVCREKNIRKVVFTSSVAVYGFAAPGTGEDGDIKPFNEYGRTKYLAEEKFRGWQGEGDNSLIIVRPTVIFGEGNRGNVFNLLNQIASGKFLMVGNGLNKKSMAYIGNIVPFLFECVKTEQKYGVFNYVDTPDLDMNTLVSNVRQKLDRPQSIVPRIPYWLGMLFGYVADLVTKISGKRLPISSIRVKKFCSSSQFASNKSSLNGFEASFTLEEAISRTLQNEFLNPNPDREVFFTE